MRNFSEVTLIRIIIMTLEHLVVILCFYDLYLIGKKNKSTRDYVLEENLLDVKKLLNKCEYLTDSENEDGE
jgi:hypothetical protein